MSETSEMSGLSRSYDWRAAEAKYYPWWESSGFFEADPEAAGEPYCIVIPPPNVTGSLHMGHALDNTLQDCLIRFHRMCGYNTVWIPGTDHAGIATQWVVERDLRERGIERVDLGREAFLERVWEWKQRYGDRITHQLRRLGVSCDWSRERFTMDEGLSEAVREVFVKLYEEGLIYRGTRLINWDPVGMTVLSDLEVEHDEGFQGELWSFAYPLSEGEGEIVVATTRPETMLGDTAVAVHPEDERYRHLIGKTVRHPLVDREIPIIADAALVDPSFGSGAVKVTPAHDPNDYEVGLRHDLPFITVLDERAAVNESGGRFAGMDRYEAREAVKAAVAELGLDRGSVPHTMSVGRSQRSGAVVEPMVSTQWFVSMKPLAAPAIAAVERGFTRFVPEHWQNTYYAWMRDIRDWCISRQLWWGHRIPAWYGPDGEVFVARSEDEAARAAAAHYGEGFDPASLRRDEDVLDTWFSSALWPFSTMGWPGHSPDLARWYPTSVLVTGFDIIFFWVARMMFSGLHHMGAVPFRDVYIHGLIRAADGQKMSKTKGNVVDPLEALDKFGADALRFTLIQSTTAEGRDFNWDEERVVVNTRFVNKIWQGFRYAHMNLEGYDPEAERSESAYDRWILARAGRAAERIRAAIGAYRFNDAAIELHAFTWGELCDWYLELSKDAIYGGAGPARAGAQHTLVTVFACVARLMHPLMPFLSEEIWQHLPAGVRDAHGETVMRAAYPAAADFPRDDAILAEVAVLQEAITALRRIKAEMQLSPGREIRVLVRGAAAGILSRHAGALSHLARVAALEPVAERPEEEVATAVIGDSELFIPLAGLVDLGAERARLRAEIAKVDKDLAGLEKKLGNASFVERAPAHVVAKFRDKREAARAKRAQLAAALEALG